MMCSRHHISSRTNKQVMRKVILLSLDLNLKLNLQERFEIWDFHGGEYSSRDFLGCDAVTLKMEAAWTSETLVSLPEHYTTSQPRRPRLETYGKIKVMLSLCFFLTEHHAMKACWGSGGIAPRILWPWWRWVVSFTPRPLWIKGWLGGLQSRSGSGGEEKDSQLLPEMYFVP
jgi:hypothetical protein